VTDDELKRLFDAQRQDSAALREDNSAIRSRDVHESAEEIRLHRRVRVLEETQRSVKQTLADVQARLERLETSTH
jgi:hypothetical protein